MEYEEVCIKFSKAQLKFLTNIDNDPSNAVIKLLKRYKKSVGNKATLETFKDFLDFSLERTNSKKDFETLTDLCDSYRCYCGTVKEEPIGKLEFRRLMEENDFTYSKAGGNVNVFRYIKFKTDEDLEWEL